jgi:hypothetical protein
MWSEIGLSIKSELLLLPVPNPISTTSNTPHKSISRELAFATKVNFSFDFRPLTIDGFGITRPNRIIWYTEQFRFGMHWTEPNRAYRVSSVRYGASQLLSNTTLVAYRTEPNRTVGLLSPNIPNRSEPNRNHLYLSHCK